MTTISTPYVGKPTFGQFLRYSFNGYDFFTSGSQFLTYLPDLLIQELSPRLWPLDAQIEVRVLAKNVQLGNKYWCETSDGQLVEAQTMQAFISSQKMNRTCIFCNLKAQSSPTQINLAIQTFGGYKVQAEQYIQFVDMSVESAGNQPVLVNVLKAFVNEMPINNNQVLLLRGEQYYLKWVLNQSLPYQDYYCLYKSTTIQAMAYLEQGTKVLYYQCQVPLIIKDSLTNISVFLVDSQKKLINPTTSYQILQIDDIQLTSLSLSFGTIPNLALPLQTPIPYSQAKLITTAVCIIDQSVILLAQFNFSSQTFTCMNVPASIRNQFAVAYQVSIQVNGLIQSSYSTQIISYRSPSFFSTSIKYSVFETNDLVKIEELFYAKQLAQSYSMSCQFDILGRAQVSSIFDPNTLSCTIPQIGRNYFNGEACSKLSVAMIFTDLSDQSNQAIMQLTNQINFCNFPSMIKNIWPSTLYIGDLRTSYLILQLSRIPDDSIDTYSCIINERTGSFFGRINQTHYFCELDMTLMNNLYFIDQLIWNVSIQNPHQTIAPETFISMPKIIAQLPSVQIVNPQFINPYIPTQWATLLIQLENFQQITSQSVAFELTFIVNGYRQITINSTDFITSYFSLSLNDQDLYFSSADQLSITTYLQLGQYYSCFKLNQMQLPILQPITLIDHSPDTIFYNSSLYFNPTSEIDPYSKIVIEVPQLPEIIIENVQFSNGTYGIKSVVKVLNGTFVQIQPLISNGISALSYYQMLLQFTYYQDIQNPITSYATQIYKQFLPYLVITDYSIIDNGVFVQLSFQSEAFLAFNELQCLMNNNVEVNFDIWNQVCEVDSILQGIIARDQQLQVTLISSNQQASNTVNVAFAQVLAIELDALIWSQQSLQLSILFIPEYFPVFSTVTPSSLRLFATVLEADLGPLQSYIQNTTIIKQGNNYQLVLNFSLNYDIISYFSQNLESASAYTLQIQILFTEFLIVGLDYRPIQPIQQKVFSPVVLEQVVYDQNTLYITSLNDIPSELYSGMALQFVLNQAYTIELPMINPNTVIVYTERMLKVLNFDRLIQKYIQISPNPLYLQVKVMFGVQEQISLNQVDATIVMRPFIFQETWANISTLYQEEPLYAPQVITENITFQFFEGFSQQTTATPNPTNATLLQLNQSSQKPSELFQRTLYISSPQVIGVSPRTILVNENGFSQILLINLNQSYELGDIQCSLNMELMSLQAQDVYQESSVIYCYFAFPNASYFQNGQGFQVGSLAIGSSNYGSFGPNMTMIFVKSNQTNISQVSLQYETSRGYQIFFTGDFSSLFSNILAFSPSCLFFGQGTTSLSIINSTFAMCPSPSYIKDQNITLALIYDKSQLSTNPPSLFNINFLDDESDGPFSTFNESLITPFNSITNITFESESPPEINQTSYIVQITAVSPSVIDSSVDLMLQLSKPVNDSNRYRYLCQINFGKNKIFNLASRLKLFDYWQQLYQCTITSDEVRLLQQLLGNQTSQQVSLDLIDPASFNSIAKVQVIIAKPISLTGQSQSYIVINTDNYVVLNVSNMLIDSLNLNIQCNNKPINVQDALMIKPSQLLLILRHQFSLSLKCQIANSMSFSNFEFEVIESFSVQEIDSLWSQPDLNIVTFTLNQDVPHDFIHKFLCIWRYSNNFTDAAIANVSSSTASCSIPYQGYQYLTIDLILNYGLDLQLIASASAGFEEHVSFIQGTRIQKHILNLMAVPRYTQSEHQLFQEYMQNIEALVVDAYEGQQDQSVFNFIKEDVLSVNGTQWIGESQVMNGTGYIRNISMDELMTERLYGILDNVPLLNATYQQFLSPSLTANDYLNIQQYLLISGLLQNMSAFAPTNAFFSGFYNLLGSYGRLTPVFNGFPQVSYFQARLNGVYQNFQKFLYPSVVSSPTPVSLAGSVNVAQPALFTVISTTPQIVYTDSISYLTVQASSFPGGQIPIQLVLKRMMNLNSQILPKPEAFILNPYQVLNNTVAVFQIYGGFKTGIYSVQLMINYQYSFNSKTLLAIRALMTNATLVQPQNVGQNFNGWVNITLGSSEFPEIGLLRAIDPVFNSMKLGCQVQAQQGTVILEGKARQESQIQYQCQLNMAMAQKPIMNNQSNALIPIDLVFYLQQGLFQIPIASFPQIQIVKSPQITKLSYGQYVAYGLANTTLSFIMTNFVQNRSYCSLGSGTFGPITNELGFYFCTLGLMNLDFSQQQYQLLVSNNIDNNRLLTLKSDNYALLMIDNYDQLSNNSNWVFTSFYVVAIKSKFFLVSPSYQTNIYRVFQSQSESYTIQAATSLQQYSDFQSVPLVCLFYNQNDYSYVAYQTQCRFSSQSLDKISFYLPAASLDRGVYNLQIVLGGTISSPIHEQYQFEVLSNPQLTDLYPRYFAKQSILRTNINMIGSGYNNLLSTQPVLFCKMLFAQGAISTIQSVLLKATIQSDNIIECEIDEFQDQYLKGLAQQVVFTLSLQINTTEIQMSTPSTSLPYIQSVTLSNLIYSEPKSITESAALRNDTIRIVTTQARLLSEASNTLYNVSYLCSFYEANNHQNLIAETSVVTVNYDPLSMNGEVFCITPSISSTSGVVGFDKLDLILHQERVPLQYSSILLAQKERVSQNSLRLGLMQQASISAVFPPKIYNLALVQQVTVTGSLFYNQENSLSCVFNNSIDMFVTKAVYQSSGVIYCPLSGISKIKETMQLSISNDQGMTWSNTLTFQIVSNLPNLLSIVSPITIYSNNKTNIVISGLNLNQLLVVKVMFQIGSKFEAIVPCNLSASVVNEVICYDVVLPMAGTYLTYIVPDNDQTQIIKTRLKIMVNQYVPVTIISQITSQSSSIVNKNTPIVIQYLSSNFITLGSLLTIYGMHFNSTNDYYVAVKFDEAQHQYYTQATFINETQIQWNFSLPIQTQKTMGDCGLIQVKSKGILYQATVPSQVKNTTVCFLKDFQVSNMTLAAFPIGFNPATYSTSVYVTNETFSEVMANIKLFQNLQTLELEFEGLGQVGCNFSNSQPVIECPIMANSNNTINQVRLWIVINSSLKFALPFTFTYYQYLTIDSLTPSSTITQQVDKELTVTGSSFLNINTLSCVFNGSSQGLLFVRAIYLNDTALVCPLTQKVYDNSHVQLQVTLNPSYFTLVSDPGLFWNLTLVRDTSPPIDLTALNVYPQFNKTQILQGQTSNLTAYNQNITNQLTTEFEAIQMVAVDKKKIMTGPWTQKLTLTLSNLTLDYLLLQNIRCLLTLQVNPNYTLSISSDFSQTAPDQLSCFFAKEIFKEGPYCLEIGLKNMPSLQTSNCAYTIEVYHIPTVSSVQSQQNSATTYQIDTELIGYYLNGYSTSWLCFTYYYDSDLNLPFSIKYDSLPASFLSPNSKLECNLSGLLEYYSVIQMIEVQGITNLNDYFYDQTVKWLDKVVDPVFMLSHLVALVDINYATQQQGATYDQMLDVNTDMVYHPGNVIAIRGFFLNNSVQGIIAKLTSAQDSSMILYSLPCLSLTPTLLTCEVPSGLTQYGEYFLSLSEVGTDILLSDESVLSLVILPFPAIISATHESFVQTLNLESQAQNYINRFTVQFDPIVNAEYINYYRQRFLDEVVCKIGDDLVQSWKNVTWVSENTVMCEFWNFYDAQDECLEISINGGKDFTSSCLTVIQSYRTPIAYSFAPTSTLIRNPATIVITGKYFLSSAAYQCFFAPLLLDSTNYTVDAVFISSSQISCTVPASIMNQTYQVQLQLFYQGLLTITFNTPFTYFDYIELLDIFPRRGSKEGGTPITINVLNMPPQSDLSYSPECQFSFDFFQSGTIFVVAATRLNDTYIECLSPNISASFNDATDVYKDVFISVNDADGVFRLQQQLAFSFVKACALTGVSPPSMYINQQLSISIFGTNILNVHSLLLRFEVPSSGFERLFRQEVLFIDSQTLIMQMPSAKDWVFKNNSRVVQIYLSLNDGVDWTTDNVSFQFYDDPQMTRLSQNQQAPAQILLERISKATSQSLSLASISVLTLLSVSSVTLTPPVSLFPHLLATVVNSTQVDCTVPPSDANKVVRMTLLVSDNYVVDSVILWFYYEDSTLIEAIVPDQGYIAGGNTVSILGDFSLFYNQSFDLYFGTFQVVDFISNSSTVLVVKVPPAPAPQDVNLYIYFNGLTYQNATVYYSYKTYSSLSQINPDFGPTMGGTLIEVFGNSFDDQAYCLLDGIIIKPIIVNSTFMLCQSPAHKAGLDYSFELEFNDFVYQTSTGLTYSYYNDVQINYLDPAFISMDAGNNKVIVTIHGYGFGFMNASTLLVRVNGNLIVPIQYNFTEITFYAPNVLQEGQYFVFVSNNGQDFQRGSSNIFLTYYKFLGVISLSVSKVQIGSNLTIEAYGYNFPTSGPFYCIFGSATTYPNIQYNVSAILNTSTQISCEIPTYEGILTALTPISFQVTYNLQEYYGDLKLLYYPAVQITSFTPPNLTQSEAEIVLTIQGQNFINTADDLTCALLDTYGNLWAAFNILFLSSQEIICSFDMLDSGDYELLIANNGLEFVIANQTLQVLDSIQVINVQPNMILSTQSDQMVFVEANNLVQDSQCIFEIIGSDYKAVLTQRDIIQGFLMNSNFLICDAPDYTGMGSVQVQLKIGYGTDPLKTQSKSSVTLNFVDRCPPGYACEDQRIIPCSKGHYCLGGGQSQTPKPCPIGYFQDKEASSLCKECSKGQMCPFSGMELPIPCPPGFICSREKLNSPEKPCTKGSYCFEGTQSADIFELKGGAEALPTKCTQGSYCREGIKTGVVILNSNSSTPSACKVGMICYEGAQDVGGVGSCPGGFFCPTVNSTGILCPPRHYCPERGNTQPIQCPRGTFNMHYGQKNCTNCTLGRYCPHEGMFMPVICPRGYACNKEGLIFPDNLCKVGHVCFDEVMTSTEVKGRSCYMAQTIGSTNPCPTGVLFQGLQNSAQKYYTYFYGQPVCCMNGTEVADYISSLGSKLNSDRPFLSYSSQINSTGNYASSGFQFLWNGMRIVDKAAYHQGFNESDGIKIPVKKHRDIIINYFWNMYTTYQQQLCPGGYLCLEGCYTYTPGDYLISMPFPCPLGSYCLIGSDSVVGSGLCPIGYFCPANTEYPQQAQPGTFTGSPGAVAPQQCQPGTFALGALAISCTECPDGYECQDKGTSTPTICLTGYFRSVTQSTVCTACPKGTFSFDRGMRDMLECNQCPPGRICENVAYNNITYSIPCTDGYICLPGSGARNIIACPNGYYCPPGTTSATQFDNECEPGFFCESGTGYSQKTRNACPRTFYCPPGTGLIDFTSLDTDYSHWVTDPATRCPYGTGLDGLDTKQSIQQCYINTELKLLSPGYDIRSQVQSATQASLSTGSSGRLLFQEEQKTELKKTYLANTPIFLDKRNLQSTGSSSSTPASALTLSSINYAIGQYNYGFGQNTQPPYNEINYNRQYIARICPLNMTLLSDYIEIEDLSDAALETNVPNVIFNLPPSAYALVTMDLRHIMAENYNWVYGEDWEISFTVDPELTIESPSLPVPMPVEFLDPTTARDQVLEFMVFSLEGVRLRIDILLYNSLYLNFRHLFVNSTSVEIRAPNRADYGTMDTFVTIVQQSDGLSLPFNAPLIMPDGQSLPPTLVSYAYSQSNWNPKQHPSIKGQTIFIPASLYWGSNGQINLPYLPYISNCKGYGSYVPLWALTEQNDGCKLIPQNETVWMTEYSFGQKPIADSCSAVTVTCIYDEIFSQSQPLPRWFEISALTPLFQITINPTPYSDGEYASFGSTDLLTVSPVWSGDYTGLTPKSYALSISYYQVNDALKRLILVSMSYGDWQELTPDEQSGASTVEYTLSFSFLPMSHTDLTINFAFSWHFYVILYLIVGIFAIINLAVFLGYHRLVVRNKDGRPFTKFKFFSYISLVHVPAIYGLMLAFIPLLIGNFFISAFVVAHVWNTQTPLYPCNDPTGNMQCVMTLFDNILDFPGDINVVYPNLRVGRCGTSMLVMGAYLLYIGISILIPQQDDEGHIEEAYDGNVWHYYTWKRSNMIFVTVAVIILFLSIIQFSYSPSYGNNAWAMIGYMQIASIIIEYIVERILQEKLLVSPFSTSLGVIQNLMTFGAINFLQFLDGFFVSVGIQMFQRPYLNPLTTFFFVQLEEKVPKVVESIQSWFKNEDELAHEQLNKEGEGNGLGQEENKLKPKEGTEEDRSPNKQKLMFEEDSQESSRSAIFYSEDSSFNSNQNDNDLDDNVNLYLQNQYDLNQSDIASVDLSREIQELEARIKHDKELLLQKEKERKEGKKNGQGENNAEGSDKDEEEFEDFDDFEKRRNESGNESDIKLDQDLEAQAVEPLIDNYYGYANDTVALLFFPFLVIQMWMFYNETQVASYYGIGIQVIIIYFLFTVVIIPFQIVLDILFLNVEEWYHGQPIHDYLDYLAFRFKTRKARWKSNETQVNVFIEENMRSLDKMCFSSQYFFVVTIYLSGMIQLILGIQILIFNNTGYNMFADFGTIPLIMFMVAVCIVVHQLCLFFGKILRIWSIDESLEKLKKQDDDIPVAQLFNRILNPEAYRRMQGINDIPSDVRFDPKKWRLVDRIKIDDDQNKHDLQTDRIVAETYREVFMKYNKPWVQEQMYELFTPRTLFEKREEIISQFKKVFGEIGADISLESEKSAASAEEGDDDSLLLDSREFNKKIFNKKKKLKPTQEELDWVKRNDVPTTRAIIRFWILRARLKQKIRMEVTKLIDGKLQKHCLYCKASYGLQVELIQNIEDVFFQFLQQKGQAINNYEVLKWQQFFERKANTRTICIDCSNAIEDYHRKLKKLLREKAERDERKKQGLITRKHKPKADDSDDEDDDDEQEESSIGLEKRKAKIRQISEGAKLVIKAYIQKARESLARQRELLKTSNKQ